MKVQVVFVKCNLQFMGNSPGHLGSLHTSARNRDIKVTKIHEMSQMLVLYVPMMQIHISNWG